MDVAEARALGSGVKTSMSSEKNGRIARECLIFLKAREARFYYISNSSLPRGAEVSPDFP
jgi:hypothetical protein